MSTYRNTRTRRPATNVHGATNLAIPAIAAAVARMATGANLPEFVQDIVAKAAAGRWATTDKQAAAVATALARLDADAERAAASTSTHVGRVGDRGVHTVTVTAAAPSDTFGEADRMRVAGTDEAGNDLVWWAGWGNDLEPGHVVTVKGTVSRHGEFRGVRTTTLNRVVREAAPVARTTTVNHAAAPAALGAELAAMLGLTPEAPTEARRWWEREDPGNVDEAILAVWDGAEAGDPRCVAMWAEWRAHNGR